MTFNFLHAYHFKFTINANIVNIPVEATFSMSTAVSILTVGLSLRLLRPDLSDPSSLTERTSDNQRIRTSKDTTSVAKHHTLKIQLD